MSDSSAGERIHQATPARLQRAKSEGDVPRSFDLAIAIQMCGMLTVLWLLAGSIGAVLRATTQQGWHQAVVSASEYDPVGMLQQSLWSTTAATAPLLLLMMLMGIASWWLQSGPLFLADKLQPDVQRLSPSNWFTRLFSLSNLAFPFVGLPRALLAAAVAATICWVRRQEFFAMANLPVDLMFDRLFGLVISTALQVAIVLLLSSVLDYALRWYSHQGRMKMTDQELRDEQRMQGPNQPFRAAPTAPKP